MVFFLNAESRIYARYGGRDAKSADSRQSLLGLKYTMQSVLEMHEREGKQFAPRTEPKKLYVRDVTGWYGGGCMHCHQVKEAINEKLVKDGRWSRDSAWRFPLPESVGMKLDLDNGNVVESVTPDTPAASAGLAPGDKLLTIGQIPIHSFADAQFALDKAPVRGALDVLWLRAQDAMRSTLNLPDDWKRADITWRTSMQRMIPSFPMSGEELTIEERNELKLPNDQFAFRAVRPKKHATESGFRTGDIILGIDGHAPPLTVAEFRSFVRHEYLVGDTVSITVLRNGETLKIPLTLNPP
jgi:predicted metalloprotease with PDZ domain